MQVMPSIARVVWVRRVVVGEPGTSLVTRLAAYSSGVMSMCVPVLEMRTRR